MEFGKTANTIEDDSASNTNIDIRDTISKYLRHWKWFLFSIIIFIFFGYLKLNFTRPQYEAKASIKIIDEKRGDKSALSSFQDIGSISSGYQDKINDEIVIITSRGLISEVIKSLQLNIRFFTVKNIMGIFSF